MNADSTKPALPHYREGPDLPGIVLGTAGLGGVWGKIDPSASRDAVVESLHRGVARIDTAPAYAKAEEIVGQALRLHGGTKPFVSTKVGKGQASSADADTNDYRLDSMARSLAQSMAVLGLDQLDLLFLHEPEKVALPRVPGVVEWLRRQRTAGRVRQLGLGGRVTPAYYPYLRDGTFDVVMSFNNLSAVDLSGMEHDLPLYRRNGLTTYQGSPLQMGLLGDRYTDFHRSPPDWLSARHLSRSTAVLAIARRNGMPLSELAHRFLYSIGEIDHLVIGARTPDQLKATLHHLDGGRLPRAIFDEIISSTQ